MTVHLSWNGSSFPPFIRCLESLPSLHTLEIGWADDFITAPLEKALSFKRVEFPQIKTLILPPSARPLLLHCSDVEDVVCVVRYETVPSDGFLGSLSSKRSSKVKRLAIPLILWPNPSRKRFNILRDHGVGTVANSLRRQDSWPHAQSSPNSLSSLLTHMAPRTGKPEFRSAQLEERARQYQSWSLRAKFFHTSTHYR